MKLTPHSPAPDFYTVDQAGKEHSLQACRGKYLVLYFYPKDNTPGCTTEACQFRDNFDEFKKYATVFGVSADSQKSHSHFAEKFSLPFPLLVDEQKKIIEAYGVDGLIFPKRTTFLISPEGKIVHIYEKVTPASHATEILKELKELEAKS